MKKFTTIILTVLFLCLLASFFCAWAIGFDAEKVYESVFVIYTDEAIGSGFAAGPNTVITNAHVIEGARTITVDTYDGNSYPAYICAADYNLDVALLVVDGAEFTPLPRGDIDASKIGEDIYTIGAPRGLSYTLTTGAISAKNREMDGYYYIQIDAPINSGNSGGPLLNDNGEVLGINTLKYTNSEGIGFAIPIDTAIDYLISCGLEFNDKGNIESTVTAPAAPSEPEEEAPDFSDFDNLTPDGSAGDTPSEGYTPPEAQPPIIIENNRTEVAVLAILFGVSFLANIGLVTYVAVKRRHERISEPEPFTDEPIEITVDPTERTDFEIEFME